MDNQSQLIARAHGVSTEAVERWVKIAQPLRKDEEKSNRFDIEGPIVSSGVWGDGSGYTTPKMLREFLAERKGEDIEIVINSPGGSVFDANAMVSDLLRHEGAIKVIVSGACFSAASDFLTIPQAERVMMPGSLIMIHNAFTMAIGDANEMRAVAERLDKMNTICIDRFVAATNHDKAELTAMMDAETWLNETEALEGGFVDSVWEGEDESEESEPEDDGEDERKGTAAISRGTIAVKDRLMAIL